MKTVQRIERHVLKKSHPYYQMLRDFCRKSKNLYNHANYAMRAAFFSSGRVIKWGDLDKQMRLDLQYPDYRDMPTAQCAQQTIKLLLSNWSSFFEAAKDYKKNPGKYLGRPRPPKYLPKDGYQVLTLTNQNCKYRNGELRFPKSFNGFTMTPQFANRPDFKSFQQVRIHAKRNRIIVELVYNIEIPDKKPYNGRTAAIDLGVNNLATVANNFHAEAFVLNGRPLKSINQFYNKQKAKLQSELMLQTGKHMSNRIVALTDWCNAKIRDYMHKASRSIINWCVKNDVTKLIVGKNDGWKQNCGLSKRNNQNFVSIPFNSFIQMLSYKAEEYGISVICVDESYTSGTSAIDNESPSKSNYNKSRRVKRGLFRANTSVYINADLNAAYQIMRKVVPFQWDSGCVLHPIIVSV